MFYETIDDITADAGIRVRAKTLKELICKVLLATFNEITDIERVEHKQEELVEVNSRLPFSVADLINKALVLHESKGFVASRCEALKADEDFLQVKLFGETFDPNKHTSKLLIKAATYHRLRVEKEGSDWICEVVFDI